MGPEVSVVIPVHNGAEYIGPAIESVLGQTWSDLEVIVVDDGSTDDTPEVVRRYDARVRCVRQDNRGVAAARNRGIAESRARYVAFLDADDLWRPEKLARQMRALRESPRGRVCATAFQVVDEQLRPLEVRGGEHGVTRDLLLRGNVVGTPSTVVGERALFEAAGGFDPALSQCADWDMWIRLSTRTEFLCLAELLVLYRSHAGNMSRSVPLLEKDSLRVLEKAFATGALPPSLQAERARAFAHNDSVLAGSYFRAGCYRDAARCAFRALRLDWRQAVRILAYPWRAGRRWAGEGRGEKSA